MILNIFLFCVIIVLWLYVGVLSFSFYSTGKFNRFFFKNIYVISILNIFQSILGVYVITTGDASVNNARWMAFSFMEINFMYFVLRASKKRHIELITMAFFNILVLTSSVQYSIVLNIAIAVILSALAFKSGVKILRRYFTWIFLLYGMTSVIPVLCDFTSTESLLIGVAFSISFLFGTIKLYKKEKVDAELKELIIDNKL